MENKAVTTYQPSASEKSSSGGQSRTMLWIIIAVVILLILIIAGIVVLAISPETVVAKVRDIFIIFMALETLLMGLVLIILILQIARLTNLLQNEIKPILESTNETVSTLRGTTTFLSDNLVQPVVKLNEYVAAVQEVGKLVGIMRKRPKKS
jgi:membrane protein implicated in regulation of membrane protease activity